MASLDAPRPCAPLDVPSPRRGVALEDVAVAETAPAAAAGPPPLRLARYVTVKINGVDRKVACY
jgi:hypothetical protein